MFSIKAKGIILLHWMEPILEVVKKIVVAR